MVAVLVGFYAALRAFRGIRNRTYLYSWFWLLFTLNMIEYFSLNVLSMLGYFFEKRVIPDEWIDDAFVVIGTSLLSVLVGHFVYDIVFSKKVAAIRMPVLSVPIPVLFKFSFFYSFFAGLAMIYLHYNRYYGYFRMKELENSIPAWMGIVSILSSLGLPLLLLVALMSDQGFRRSWSYVLVVIWVAVGLLSGFKLQVFLPIGLLAVASWMNGRLRWRYIGATFAFMFVAYSVIEPLRLQRDSYGEVDVSTAYENILGGDSLELYSFSTLFESVVTRVDSTRIGAIALHYYRTGRLGELKMRVDEAYSLVLPLAFVPRALWPDKPLADLGKVLSVQMTGIETNSLSLVRPVSDYIWGGFPAVILLGVLWGMCMSVASQFMSVWIKNPLQMLFMLFLALNMSIGSDYTLYMMINIMRGLASLMVAIFVLRMLGIVHLRRIQPVFAVMSR